MNALICLVFTNQVTITGCVSCSLKTTRFYTFNQRSPDFVRKSQIQEYIAPLMQARSQKILLGSAFEEKVDLLIVQYSPGAVAEFIIVWCMLIAHIHEGLY